MHVAIIYFSSVSSVSYVCLQVFYLDVVYVCNSFIVFLGVFASVSEAYLKCFTYLLLYVATVASGCFKIRSSACTWDARGKRLAT